MSPLLSIPVALVSLVAVGLGGFVWLTAGTASGPDRLAGRRGALIALAGLVGLAVSIRALVG